VRTVTTPERPQDTLRAFYIGGPATASWREHALARAAEYRFLARCFLTQGNDRNIGALQAIEKHIDAAERSASGHDTQRRSRADRSNGDPTPTLRGWAKLKSFVGGAAVERTNSQLDAVEADLLRLLPDPYLRGQLPNLVAHVRAHLKPDDPRRRRVEEIARKVACGPPRQKLEPLERDEVLGAVRSASLEARREIRRVRSFRNVLLVTALTLAVGVAGVTTMGVLSPGRIALCFVPDNQMVVCPTSSAAVPEESQPSQGEETPSVQQQVDIDQLVRDTASRWDVPVVAIVGLLAAALAGAFALRQIQGTSTPYSLPVSAAVLKLPTGALTAVIGLLLMRGGFVPGLTALDTSAQIIAWAVVFGYSQQLLTRFVDQQANTVLEKVDTPTFAQLEPPSAPPSTQARSPGEEPAVGAAR
jgi:hypothetical protein